MATYETVVERHICNVAMLSQRLRLFVVGGVMCNGVASRGRWKVFDDFPEEDR